ncbi:MAG TPA: hypothetical protein VN193_02910 [Candidatus Angelobacter sp.]|nr:hypothetical protein [Candidatus Angelobacter sp.]
MPTGKTPPSQPSAVQLARSALATLHLGAPRMGMAPPSDKLVVNLATYLWVDPTIWRSFAATASVGPISATVIAAPSRVVWTMGNGDSVTCTGPGVPYDPNKDTAEQPTNCGYSYSKASKGQPNGRFSMTTRVYWHVTWTSSGVAAGGDLGEVAGDPATTSVEVDAVRSVNT